MKVRVRVSGWPRLSGRAFVRLVVAAVLVALAAAAVWEARTSTLQAWYFTREARDVGYAVVDGPSARTRFPSSGPMDERLGYTRLPSLVSDLETRGFRIERQAEVSPGFASLVDRGVFPLYREKLQGGLTLLDRHGRPFYAAPSPREVYPSFGAIPEIVWRVLLFIESRDFLDERYPNRNPAVEWDRLARSVVDLGLQALGSERNVPGGSTVATQLEKFRHAPGGRTGSVRDKLVQMETSALRAYADGPRTLEARRRIVRDYLNSVPLAAQAGHGEVVGIADGLFAWYGTPFDEANRLLAGALIDGVANARQAEVFRQVLSLMIAHRRPSHYLVQPAGRDELNARTDAYLALLADAGEIPRRLATAARSAHVTVLSRAPERPPAPFIRQKAANQIRTYLLSLFALPRLYDLDRFDLTVATTLDVRWQATAADFIERLERPEAVRELGFAGAGLLDRGDPARVIYSFTLLETTPLGNVVRVQTDNYDGPLSFAQASRVELGSTAKLRALVTYLEAIAEAHGRLAPLAPDALRALPIARQDVLTQWVRDSVLADPGASLESVLEAAMARRYSASPAERFVTGGGTQTFANFDRTYDGSVLTVTEAFRHSVNLPMIRLMRDVVSYYMFRSPETTARVLADVDDPARRDYLARFADREGGEFVRQFYRKYQGSSGEALLSVLTGNRRLGPQRTAWALRAIRPEAPVEELATTLLALLADDTASRPDVEALLRRSDPADRTLNDLGYLARIHPLELWVVRYLLEHPQAGLADVLEASRSARQDVYAWLFRTSRRNVQDQRIRSMLELEAFQGILAAWRRVGYPFDNIVPSFGTAIGSSGDRPVALAELVGIILNGGIRHPIVRVETLDFADGTPFETGLERTAAAGETVMNPVVATVVRRALVDVVERGTARRARGALLGPDGTSLIMGGKTGTGDNRFRVFGSGGRLLESRPVNRTATLAFFAGDRYFGVVTAYVPGQEAGDYRFTSALPAEILRQIGALLGSLEPVVQQGRDASGADVEG